VKIYITPFYPMVETMPLQQPSTLLPFSDLDLECAEQDVLRSADLNSVSYQARDLLSAGKSLWYGSDVSLSRRIRQKN
jgi:hypothetical protein